jgi:hypothetical protein
LNPRGHTHFRRVFATLLLAAALPGQQLNQPHWIPTWTRYGGVGNSVGIEFDTYDNGGADGDSSNHVAIDEDGNITNGTSQSDRNRQAACPTAMSGA